MALPLLFLTLTGPACPCLCLVALRDALPFYCFALLIEANRRADLPLLCLAPRCLASPLLFHFFPNKRALAAVAPLAETTELAVVKPLAHKLLMPLVEQHDIASE